jgi:hypothetical protein
VSPGDRIARTLNALDGLPRLARLTLMILVPLVLLAALVATFAIAPRGPADTASTRRNEARQSPARHRLVPPSRPAATETSQEPALSSASHPALGFLRGYLAFSYGRGTVDAIRNADRRLIASLRESHARIPPAERKRHPRVATLQIVPQAHGAVQATATITDGSGPQYPLVFYLDRRPSGWVVTRLGDD